MTEITELRHNRSGRCAFEDGSSRLVAVRKFPATRSFEETAAPLKLKRKSLLVESGQYWTYREGRAKALSLEAGQKVSLELMQEDPLPKRTRDLKTPLHEERPRTSRRPARHISRNDLNR